MNNMEELEDKPLLEMAVFTFLQETNCNGSTGKSNEDEKLMITMESGLGGLDKDGGFYVLRTEGWSINKPKDLLYLFEQIKNIKC